MIKTQTISIQCPECGAIDFQRPENIQDDDFVICNNCNFEIIFGDLKQIGLHQAELEIKKEIHDMIKNKFKNILKKR